MPEGVGRAALTLGSCHLFLVLLFIGVVIFGIGDFTSMSADELPGWVRRERASRLWFSGERGESALGV
jgi:hypothetical protein